MSQSKISSIKQKVSAKLHHQKTDTQHMTGKNTDLSATRDPSEGRHHNPGYVTATQSSHFDNTSKTVDVQQPNPDFIRQDSEEGLGHMAQRSQMQSTVQPTATYTTRPSHVSLTEPVMATDLNHNGVPDSLERTQFQGQTYQGSDLNRNGIPDQMENRTSTQSGSFNQDLNRNGIPDQFEQRGSYTDLNRNGVPDQLETRSSFVAQPTLVTSNSVTNLPETVEHVTKPAIVHEVITQQETREIQPVIERSREQTDIYEVVKPITQVEVMPTEVRNVTLAPKFIPVVRETEYVESQATIPVQVVRTIHVPVSQVTAVTTTRMMTTEESRAYAETQMPTQFTQKTTLNNVATVPTTQTTQTTSSTTF